MMNMGNVGMWKWRNKKVEIVCGWTKEALRDSECYDFK